MAIPSSPLSIYCADRTCLESARALAQQLQRPILSQPPADSTEDGLVVVYDDGGISLQFTGRKAPGPIRVDFVEGAAAHRRHYGGGKSQLIAKAVGLKGKYRPHVVDVTAGLGQDGFVLATLGCEVTLVERVPIIFYLLEDGLQRALQAGDNQLQHIIQAIKCHQQSGHDYLQSLPESVDVIYLDPMFPEREKSAQVNKSMRAFQQLVGGDNDAGELLQLALQKARYRVVIKRPRKAPGIHQQYNELNLPEPGLVLAGKSSRYDIYPLAKMP